MSVRRARLRVLTLLQRLEDGERVTRTVALRELQQIHDELVPETAAQERRRNMAVAEAKSVPWSDPGRLNPAEPTAETR